jgi:hypothetical protein
MAVGAGADEGIDEPDGVGCLRRGSRCKCQGEQSEQILHPPTVQRYGDRGVSFLEPETAFIDPAMKYCYASA